ncbi:MAG: ribosome silencing factor [Henriciella sp.]|uniref:ribosome silencing factor n=1 Tax=Henriciella sp. TaxID=1968823 RepID=UPI003C75F96B
MQPLKAAKASVDDIRALAETVINSLEDDKAEDIKQIDLQGKSSLADVMVIASGRSARHVASIADHLAQTIKDATGRPVKIEGLPNADWVLLDIGDIIIHLFRPEVRTFYNLEKIWADGSAHGHA